MDFEYCSSVEMWKDGFGKKRFNSGATGLPTSTALRIIHGAIISSAAALNQSTGFHLRKVIRYTPAHTGISTPVILQQ